LFEFPCSSGLAIGPAAVAHRFPGQEITMKIGPIDSKFATLPVQERRAAPAGGGAADTAREPSAQVALSPAAKLLSSVAASSGSFDSAKVESIAQAIREGRFTVNADAIADKLIDNAEELLGRRI
jgi:negative regulator of flagellin synthesis FlgM